MASSLLAFPLLLLLFVLGPMYGDELDDGGLLPPLLDRCTCVPAA
jgi:hypothetical protein